MRAQTMDCRNRNDSRQQLMTEFEDSKAEEDAMVVMKGMREIGENLQLRAFGRESVRRNASASSWEEGSTASQEMASKARESRASSVASSEHFAAFKLEMGRLMSSTSIRK